MRGSAMTLASGVSLCFGLLLCTAAAAQQIAAMPGDGEDAALVEGTCTACHNAATIARSSGYSREDWQDLTGSMIDLSGDPEMRDRIVAYLTDHFPPHGKRSPLLVEGDTRLSFTEWQVPTLGQRARDPVEAPDGSIWWAGQFANLIGRIDPKTGTMQEFDLPAGAMPHSVTPDADGNVWYTGNKNGTVGKLDPRTGKITEFKMPDPAARDPHTAVFDAKGVLWFTLQQSNMIGRLDPGTGDIKLVRTTTPGARPYGIKIDADGNPWFACNGSNCLVKVDPESMELTEVKLPGEGTHVRRLDIAADGMIWYVNSGRGRLGRLDPGSGEIKEWPSPSGPDSHPYAIAVVDGIVWYNESGKRPDALVRFDPRSEKFQSWPIPSGGFYAGIVRHMRAAKNGDLLIHQSSTNRIMRVSIDDSAAR